MSAEEKRLRDLLESRELKDLETKLKNSRKEQKQQQKNIVQQIAKVVASKFTQETVSELEALEKREVELDNEQINVLGRLIEARQKQRRLVLGDEQRKLGNIGASLSNSAEIFAQSVPRDLRSVFQTQGSGSQTRALGRGRGNNPFLDACDRLGLASYNALFLIVRHLAGRLPTTQSLNSFRGKLKGRKLR